MQVVRLEIEYDGMRFSGWAEQPKRRTCEGVLAHALRAMLRTSPELQVAGRTDTGVHASGQVASFVSTADVDVRRLVKGLAGLLPPDIAVRSASIAPPGFNARTSAIGRSYEYRVLVGTRSPLRRERVLHHPQPLDLDAMNDAAAACVGQHDFTAFTPSKTEHVFFDRTVRRSVWETRGDEVVLAIEADAFLRNMVRILVGTMLEVGRGSRPPGQMSELLAGAPRAAAGRTAPAHPLTLVGVRYPEPVDSAPILGVCE
jgi:tRNA pseudouridine38-40 synthase